MLAMSGQSLQSTAAEPCSGVILKKPTWSSASRISSTSCVSKKISDPDRSLSSPLFPLMTKSSSQALQVALEAGSIHTLRFGTSSTAEGLPSGSDTVLCLIVNASIFETRLVSRPSISSLKLVGSGFGCGAGCLAGGGWNDVASGWNLIDT